MSYIRTPAGLAPRSRPKLYSKKLGGSIEKPRPAGTKHLPCGAATKTRVGGGRVNPRVRYSI
jgi:hypothetical protein